MTDKNGCYEFHNTIKALFPACTGHANDNGIEHGLSAMLGSPDGGKSSLHRLWSALRRIFRAWGW